MARITVEDCLEQVDNRFNLVLIASKRARQLSHGKEPKVDVEHDKATVIALREIASGLVTSDILNEDEIDPMDAFETIEEITADDLDAAEDKKEGSAVEPAKEVDPPVVAEKNTESSGE